MISTKDIVEYSVNGKSRIKTSFDKIKIELTNQLADVGIKTEFVNDYMEEKSLFKTIRKDFLIMYNAEHKSDYLYYAFCEENGQIIIYVGGNTPMADFLKAKGELKSSGKSFSDLSDAYNESSSSGKLVFGGVAAIKQVKNVGGVLHGAAKTVFSKKDSREEEQEYCCKVDTILSKVFM